MLSIACLAGVLLILLVGEHIGTKLRPEIRRKSIHIAIGVFVASWPWLISWQMITFIGLLMLLIVWINRYAHFFKFNKNIRRRSDGDYLFALAIILTSLLTSSKVIFAIAILNMALADGFAAISGMKWGSATAYKIWGQKKSLVGSMVFWLTSTLIVGSLLPLDRSLVDYQNYLLVLLLLPPILTAVENISKNGSDNLTIPTTTLVVLFIAAH